MVFEVQRDNKFVRIWRGFDLALPILEKGGLDMLLIGHIHESSLNDMKTDLMLTTRSILAIGAGTAISTRTRGEPNSYNIIEVENKCITLKLRVWPEGEFRQAGKFAFRKEKDVWKKDDPVQNLK